MKEKKATVFDIQRFSLHDGPGIRTTVFLKGCPLNCLWCHNPESKSGRCELMLHASRCMGCGGCVSVCSRGVHSFSEDGAHMVDREACLYCGKCAEVCVGALEICGREMTVDEMMDEVLKDKEFYENSGGGLTVSGGEPLANAEFSLALLTEAKRRGMNTAIETSGFAKWETLKPFAECVDLFLWDAKETDAERHKLYTGVDNRLILENLRKLNGKGARIVLRCPVIPGCNDREEHFKAIGALAEELSGVERVDVEPYHPLGMSKAESLGRKYLAKDIVSPSDGDVKRWVEIISVHTSKKVVRS